MALKLQAADTKLPSKLINYTDEWFEPHADFCELHPYIMQ